MNRDELIQLLKTDPEVRFAVYMNGLVAENEIRRGKHGNRFETESDAFHSDKDARHKAWEIGAGIKTADA